VASLLPNRVASLLRGCPYHLNKEAMMRRSIVTISLLALLVAACGTSQPGKPSPTVLGTEAPAPATAAPAAPAPQRPAPVYTPPPMPHY